MRRVLVAGRVRGSGVGRQFLLPGVLQVPGVLAVVPDSGRGSAVKLEGAITFGARGDSFLVLAAGQPGDHAGGQGGRRAQDRGQLVRAQLRPAFLDSAGLEPGDDLPSALLLLRGRVRFQAGLLEKNMRGTVTWSWGMPRARRVRSCIMATQPWPQW